MKMMRIKLPAFKPALLFLRRKSKMPSGTLKDTNPRLLGFKIRSSILNKKIKVTMHPGSERKLKLSRMKLPGSQRKLQPSRMISIISRLQLIGKIKKFRNYQQE